MKNPSKETIHIEQLSYIKYLPIFAAELAEKRTTFLSG